MSRLAITAAAGAAAIATVTAATAGLTPASAEAPAVTSAAPALKWSTCTDEALRTAKAECAQLTVPLDYSKPAGKKISMAVSRMKATAAAGKQQGPLLVNPGGPGGSGLQLPLYLNHVLPADVRSTYDLIGFDPRGVGASKPALSCDKQYNKGPRPDYTPMGDPASKIGANETAWLARSKAYADACAKSAGWLLPYLTTMNTVRDMDTLRAALGAQQLNYYGFSYGTYLGQVYATTYPDRVRRMIFDGNVNPTNIWYDAQLEQDRAFERAMAEFFAWIASHDNVFGLGATPGAVLGRYKSAQAELRTKPVGEVGPAEWTDVFLPAGYTQDRWDTIATAFSHWVKGDTSMIVEQWKDAASLGDDNSYAMYVGVQCVDAAWPRDYKTWRADGFATAASAPFETWGNVWFNTPCIFWHAPQGTPPVVDGSRAPGILLVNTTLDGATPYSGALLVRGMFPRSSLVAEVGNTTHANSLGGNKCVDEKVFEYLRSGTLPARKSGAGPDVECAASPLPKPDPLTGAASPASPLAALLAGIVGGRA